MTTPTPDVTSSPKPVQTALSPAEARFLLRLARRYAVAVLEANNAGAGQTCRIETTDDSTAGRTSSVQAAPLPAAILTTALAAGYLEPGGQDRHFRLSRLGRSLARQLRSTRLADGIADRPAGIRPATARPQINPAESPLAWLSRRLDRDGKPMISQAQFDAGERFREDFWLAGHTPRTTQSWSGIAHSRRTPRATPGSAAGMSDRLVAARQRIDRALVAIGPEHGSILIDVCGHLRGLEDIEKQQGWPQRSAKLILLKALTALARHYGLLPPVDSGRMLASRVRQWGTPDFRPGLDRWRNSDPGPASG